MAKIDKGDEVSVRGEVYRVEEDGWVRVKFMGHQYPVLIHPHAIEQVGKGKPPKEPKVRDRRKPLIDKPT